MESFVGLLSSSCFLAFVCAAPLLAQEAPRPPEEIETGTTYWDAKADAHVEVPYPPGWENLYHHHLYRDAELKQVLQLAFSSPHQDDTPEGARTYKMWYRVYAEGDAAPPAFRPLIQDGPGRDSLSPIEPVRVPINSYVASTPPPSRASNGEIMVPFYFWPLGPDGRRLHEDAYSFTSAGVLIARWSETGDDVLWSLGETVHLDIETQSTRGAMEPAILELSDPGSFVMILRASNLHRPEMPSYKWVAASSDYCRTWSAPQPLRFDDGEPVFSPSACSDLRRHSSNGRSYWIGNISPTNANGNGPRYPLVIAEFDETNHCLIRDSVRVIDTRDPARDTEQLELSNFSVKEDPAGGFVVSLTRYDFEHLAPGEDWRSREYPRVTYRVPLQ